MAYLLKNRWYLRGLSDLWAMIHVVSVIREICRSPDFYHCQPRGRAKVRGQDSCPYMLELESLSGMDLEDMTDWKVFGLRLMFD